MDENTIRQIVREEIADAAQKAQYSVTRVPVHTHNNIDSANLSPYSITGFQALPGKGGGVLALAAGQTVSGPPSDNNILNPPLIMVFPMPVIYAAGAFTSFNTGTAPNGTAIFFDTGSKTTSALWIKTLNGWYFITPDGGPL